MLARADEDRRWHVVIRYGTEVGRHPEGFETEREARLDAERLRAEIAVAPIVGSGAEGGS